MSPTSSRTYSEIGHAVSPAGVSRALTPHDTLTSIVGELGLIMRPWL